MKLKKFWSSQNHDFYFRIYHSETGNCDFYSRYYDFLLGFYFFFHGGNNISIDETFIFSACWPQNFINAGAAWQIIVTNVTPYECLSK